MNGLPLALGVAAGLALAGTRRGARNTRPDPRGPRLAAQLARRRHGSPNVAQVTTLSQPLQDLWDALDMSPAQVVEEMAYHATYLLWNSLEEAGEHKLANAYEASDYDTGAMLEKVRTTKRLGQAWLDAQAEGWRRDLMQDDPATAPSCLFFDTPTILKNAWLIHFTDHANAIARQGFTRGLDDPRSIGLTTHFTSRAKTKPGYVFAYRPEDVRRYAFRSSGSTRYGREAVLFRADAIVAYHHSDEEPQAISWGPESKDRHALTVEGRQLCLDEACYSDATNLVADVESRR